MIAVRWENQRERSGAMELFESFMDHGSYVNQQQQKVGGDGFDSKDFDEYK